MLKEHGDETSVQHFHLCFTACEVFSIFQKLTPPQSLGYVLHDHYVDPLC